MKISALIVMLTFVCYGVQAQFVDEGKERTAKRIYVPSININDPAYNDFTFKLLMNGRLRLLGEGEYSGDIMMDGKSKVPLANRLRERYNNSLQPISGGDLLMNAFTGVALNINGGLKAVANSVTADGNESVLKNSVAFTINTFIDTAVLKTLFVVKNHGYVGIGTTNPKEMLSVAGNIQAKKVKVTTNTSDWPDYVFDAGYQLPTLAETAAYVKEHKHLPGIPAAAEVERDGQDLGEMNKLLLKKIEELTLHLIELQAKVEKLEAGKK